MPTNSMQIQRAAATAELDAELAADPTNSANPGEGATGPNGGYKTAAMTVDKALESAIKSINDSEGKTEGGQYQDADAAAAADPVQKEKVAMSQMDASAQVDNPSQGGSGGSPMEGQPGQQGGSDALAASNKTSAEGAAAVAAIEGMAGGQPESRPAFVQSQNPFARGARKYAPRTGASKLFKRF